jgi:hypothetical protein
MRRQVHKSDFVILEPYPDLVLGNVCGIGYVVHGFTSDQWVNLLQFLFPSSTFPVFHQFLTMQESPLKNERTTRYGAGAFPQEVATPEWKKMHAARRISRGNAVVHAL